MKHVTKVNVNGKEYTKEDIQVMLATRDEAVVRGMIRIYEYQTQYEKSVEGTVEDNGVGFNGADAPIMSSFVKWATTHNNTLTPKQMFIARKKMKKYAGQILRLMAGAQ